MAEHKFMKGQQLSQSKKKTKQFSIERSNKTKQYKNSLMTTLAEQSEQFITNLSRAKLSHIEKNALGKSLNFVPTPAKPTRVTLLSDINVFQRIQRIAYIMHNKPSKTIRSTTIRLASKNLKTTLKPQNMNLPIFVW